MRANRVADMPTIICCGRAPMRPFCSSTVVWNDRPAGSLRPHATGPATADTTPSELAFTS